MKKHTNPEAHGYLLEAKACKQILKELRRISDRYQHVIDKGIAVRKIEFETVMKYTSEQQIQDDYGWEIITERQYEWYLDLFRNGQEALEKISPSVKVLALRILLGIIRDIESDCRK
ncbi:adenylosuccinate lyase [Anaerotignum sp.]|uniref:adenylosuccinate lyase n=1 Tax=Anaerotignum sp. TaxID=2039241 RepID=UPI0028B1E371|nr:adenylosuccinate lyase [Anaerotignum sp.]